MTSTGDPLVGHLLDGRYLVTGRLARGGMATVYLATDTRLTRAVAVKVMHVGLGDDVEFAKKFDREARAAARLSHPNVVSVFDQGQDNGRPYIVMEHVEGQTLRDVMTRDAPVTPLRALEMIEPVLAALSAAHDAGLVHRDVKPENVLISDRGQIKVADFGLAKAISAQTSTATQGLLIGTVSYLPPELVVSGRADARSDVYSTGVVLFELLTGRKPHTGDTPIAVAYAHVHKDVPAPSTMHTAGPIPPYLDALIARATARDPDLRPHDAKVFLTQVRRVRAALRDGVLDDPELTQDLTIPLRPMGDSGSADATGQGQDHHQIDRADYEATQMVAAAEAERQVPRLGPAMPWAGEPVRSAPAWDQRTSDWETADADPAPGAAPSPGPAYAPPHMLDARPPAVPRDLHSRDQHSRDLHSRDHRLSPQRREEQRVRQVRKRRRGWLALLLVLLLTTIAAVTGWYLVDGRFTSAPPLTSLSQTQAREAAADAGLSISFATEFSESIAKGMVISTEPGPGSKILDGGEIAAVVSKGPERFAMPKVTGLTQDTAEAAVTRANLRVGSVTQRYDDEAAKAVVLEASQKAGASLKRDTGIDLVVSRGPQPIKITDYVGKKSTTAQAALKKAGFTVTVTRKNDAKIAAGLVISQTPSDGNGIKGDKVELVESLGPVMVTVPNVRAMGVKAATEVMEKAGFRVKTARSGALYLGVGFVASTDPKARTKVPEGSTITLYLV